MTTRLEMKCGHSVEFATDTTHKADLAREKARRSVCLACRDRAKAAIAVDRERYVDDTIAEGYSRAQAERWATDRALIQARQDGSE